MLSWHAAIGLVSGALERKNDCFKMSKKDCVSSWHPSTSAAPLETLLPTRYSAIQPGTTHWATSPLFLEPHYQEAGQWKGWGWGVSSQPRWGVISVSEWSLNGFPLEYGHISLEYWIPEQCVLQARQDYFWLAHQYLYTYVMTGFE